MGHFTLSDGLAIWELIYYVVALSCSVVVSSRHGLSRSSGWVFLAIFSTIRVTGCSAQIATVVAKSDTAETVATIMGFLGLSPLLLATLGILSRVYFSILKMPWNFVFGLAVIKMAQVPAATALILCIIGATSANTPAEIANQDTVKAGVVVYLIVLIILGLLTMGAGIAQCLTGRRGESTLLHVVAASLPFLLLRIIHSFLLVFSKHFQASAAKASTSSIIAELFMARIEEMIIVLLFLWAGLTHEAVPRNEDGTKRSSGEKLMYQAGRGDFGAGKLGMASLAVSAVIAMCRKESDKDKSQVLNANRAPGEA
ncbi:hypothetical protein PT974_10379 [Cladobotryum mycophilum]|uniref:DUF7702 domain-containing protein n=1 Tax=Cladobotryum mycophilum TaxID=491253 RepID=A0ABR0S9P6_9HYPO